MLARRGYNIQSLAVGNSESPDLSRITTVIPGSKESSAKVIKQLLKLIHVHSVTDLSDLPFIARELMLIKCRCRPAERKELIDLAEIFHGNVCDVSRTTITLEVQGKEAKMRAVQDLIAPYGVSFLMLFVCHVFAVSIINLRLLSTNIFCVAKSPACRRVCHDSACALYACSGKQISCIHH